MRYITDTCITKLTVGQLTLPHVTKTYCNNSSIIYSNLLQLLDCVVVSAVSNSANRVHSRLLLLCWLV